MAKKLMNPHFLVAARYLKTIGEVFYCAYFAEKKGVGLVLASSAKVAATPLDVHDPSLSK